MPYVDPRGCYQLPFAPLQPVPSGVFATPAENSPVGYRRIAPSQTGLWTLQPKYDMYRVIINTSGNGTIFNTLGLVMPESGSGLFKDALSGLCAAFPNEWMDCFIRALKSGDNPNFGQGAILVNDIFLPGIQFWERQGKIGNKIPELGICRQLPHRQLYKVPNFPEHVGIELWAALKELQTKWSTRGTNYYTGIVAKSVTGMYEPREAGYQCGAWMSYPFSPTLSVVVKPVGTVKQPELALTPETCT